MYNIHKIHLLLTKLLRADKVLEVPDIHTDILNRFINQDERLQATIAPVGFSKSALAKSYALNNIFSGVKFQLYVSSSFTKVVNQFTTFLSLSNDPILSTLFNFQVVTLNQNEIVYDFNGDRRKIQGVASGSDILGINFESQRPQVIIIDDIEEQDQANSVDRTEALIEWINVTLLSRLESADKGLVRLIGTNLSTNSVVNRMLEGEFTGWNVKRYTALENDKSVWEEQHSTEGLLALKHANPKSFAANYMNAPLDSMTSAISKQDIRYYDAYKIEDFDSLYLHVDTTHTGKQTSDFFCAGVFGENKHDHDYYLLDFVLDKMDVGEQAKVVIVLYQAFQEKIKKITYDEKANQGFGYWIKKLAKEDYSLSLPIEELKYPNDKVAHFDPHVPHFKANRVKLPRHHKQIHEAVKQLENFPSKAINDDFVDMISGCLDNFKKPKRAYRGVSF